MQDHSTPARLEEDRLGSLQRYDILDTPREEAFDRIARLARQLLRVPTATLTFIDGHRLWFKARLGLEQAEIPRSGAFCSSTIAQDDPLVIPDTLADPRFADSPFVRNDPRLRFYAGVPLRSPDGQNIGTLCAMDTQPHEIGTDQVEALVDLAQIVMNELELRLLATTDSLTGTLARRGFRDEVTRALALAKRHRHDLSLVMLDIDHFKVVNDTHGHATGDIVLKQTVATCRALLRKSDMIGRLGGEEFAILLQHTGGQAALRVAEKLRKAIARHRVQGAAGPFGVTASFGVVSVDRTATDTDSLLERADAALYEAKGEGRNRCVVWKQVQAAEPAVRRRVFKAGRLSFNSGRSTIDCTVRTLSGSGATIDVISTAGVPDQFKLQIEADHFSQLCRVAGKTERHLELAFA